MGTRWELLPSDSTYLRVLVADGVPGDPGDPRGTQIVLDRDDGLLLAAEAGFLNLPSQEFHGRARRQADELPPADRRYGFFGKYAVGAWRYTGEFDAHTGVDQAGDALQVRADPGAYALAEQRVWCEPQDPFQGLTAFARAGFADEDTNVFDRYLGAGLIYRGPISGRDRDRLGIAVAAARLGGAFRASRGASSREWETAFELTYRCELEPWFSIQPNVQHVVHPGGDPALSDATLVGARLLASF